MNISLLKTVQKKKTQAFTFQEKYTISLRIMNYALKLTQH